MHTDALRKPLVVRFKRLNDGILNVVIDEDGMLEFAHPILEILHLLLNPHQFILVNCGRQAYFSNKRHGVSML
jgi:hypothetical protein